MLIIIPKPMRSKYVFVTSKADNELLSSTSSSVTVRVCTVLPTPSDTDTETDVTVASKYGATPAKRSHMRAAWPIG
jgi:hypothetical protein